MEPLLALLVASGTVLFANQPPPRLTGIFLMLMKDKKRTTGTV